MFRIDALRVLSHLAGSRCDTATPLTMSSDFKSLQIENRVFPPSDAFKAQARISSMDEYKRLHAESVSSPETYWGREAGELHWQQKWSKVLDWQPPFAKWFVGAKLNVCENCVDRHLTNGRKDK